MRFRVADVVGAYDGAERVAQPTGGEDALDLPVQGPGGHAQRVVGGQRPHQLAGTGEERYLRQQLGVSLRLDPGQRLHALAVGGLAVPLEGDADRAAVVVGQVMAVVLVLFDGDARGEQGVALGAEVEPLAVDEDAVEVEDHRPH